MILLNRHEMTANEYLFIEKERMIREICHPAEIDAGGRLIIMKSSAIGGRDTDLIPDTFCEFFLNLPQWDRTTYYQINDNLKNRIFFCKSGIPVQHSR